MLVELLCNLKGLLQVKSHADIDSAVFKLHYRVTTTMLFSFSLLVTCKGLLGDPINCVHGNSPYLPDAVINTYCWITTTFTLPRYLHEGAEGTLMYPGVGPPHPGDEKIYHAYYQWVPFVLFFQGLLFYVPHWLWKIWEGGKLDAVVGGLVAPLLPTKERNARISILKDYLHTSLHRHNLYAYKFFFCEWLNFVNVMSHMWLLDRFFGGMFMTYGMDVVNYSEQNQAERSDPMIVMFPRVTKCMFYMYGPSGTVEKHDVMCVLGLNVINEKIFVFLWFWFVILITLTCIAFIYRVLLLCTPVVRHGLLQKRAVLKHKSTIELLIPKLQVGDYLLLYLISKNIELMSFSALLEELAIELSNDSRKYPRLGEVRNDNVDNNTENLKVNLGLLSDNASRC